MDKFEKAFIEIIKSGLTGKTATLESDFDWTRAIEIGKRHNVIPLMYYGVVNSQLSISLQLEKYLESVTIKNVYVSNQQLYEISSLCKEFNNNGIDYMLLKGSVIKKLYPKPEMRPMGDADILVKSKQYKDIKKIMKKRGYNELYENDQIYSWEKNEILHVELHKRLFPSYTEDLYEYYGDGWNYARLASGNYFEMSIEDFYIFLFVHFVRHYRLGGIGIRHLTDLYVVAQKNSLLDMEYIKQEFKKLNLYDFYQNVNDLINTWFSDAQSNDIIDFITNKIFESGSYGTKHMHDVSRELWISNTSNVKCRFLVRLFPPYFMMCRSYKILKKIPLLLPLFWVVRLIRASLFRKQNMISEYNNIKNISKTQINKYKKELEFVGLDSNFKE